MSFWGLILTVWSILKTTRVAGSPVFTGDRPILLTALEDARAFSFSSPSSPTLAMQHKASCWRIGVCSFVWERKLGIGAVGSFICFFHLGRLEKNEKMKCESLSEVFVWDSGTLGVNIRHLHTDSTTILSYPVDLHLPLKYK